MIRNGHVPNSFRPGHQMGKKDVIKATALQSKHYKQKAKRIGRLLQPPVSLWL